MSARRLELPVLIVGAGPAGLMAAAALARAGIDCLLVERRRELSSLPRATAISTLSMELLSSWGLEVEVRVGGALLARPDGAPVDWFAPRTDALPSLRTALTRPIPAAEAPKAA